MICVTRSTPARFSVNSVGRPPKRLKPACARQCSGTSIIRNGAVTCKTARISVNAWARPDAAGRLRVGIDVGAQIAAGGQFGCGGFNDGGDRARLGVERFAQQVQLGRLVLVVVFERERGAHGGFDRHGRPLSYWLAGSRLPRSSTCWSFYDLDRKSVV